MTRVATQTRVLYDMSGRVARIGIEDRSNNLYIRIEVSIFGSSRIEWSKNTYFSPFLENSSHLRI